MNSKGTLNSTHGNWGSSLYPWCVVPSPTCSRAMERTSTLIFWERLPQMWRAEVGWGAEVVNVPQQIYEYPSILRKWVSKDVPTTSYVVQLSIRTLRSTVSFRWSGTQEEHPEASASFWRCDDGQEAGVRGETRGWPEPLDPVTCEPWHPLRCFTQHCYSPTEAHWSPKEWHPMGNFCFSGIDNEGGILFWNLRGWNTSCLKHPKDFS